MRDLSLTWHSPRRPAPWLEQAAACAQAGDEPAALEAWERGAWALRGAARQAALRELSWTLGDVDAPDSGPAARLYREAARVQALAGEPGQIEALTELLGGLREARPELRTRTRWLLLEQLAPVLGPDSREVASERAALRARLAEGLAAVDRPPEPARDVPPRGQLLELIERAEVLSESSSMLGAKAEGLARLGWLYARLGEHLPALQAAEVAEQSWGAGDDTSLRGLSQARVAAIRERVSGAGAGLGDLEQALASVEQAADPGLEVEVLLRVIVDAFDPSGPHMARALAQLARLDDPRRARVIRALSPLLREHASERAVELARASAAPGDFRLACAQAEALRALGALDEAAARAVVETYAAYGRHGLLPPESEALVASLQLLGPDGEQALAVGAALPAASAVSAIFEAARLQARDEPDPEQAGALVAAAWSLAEGRGRQAVLAAALPLLLGSASGEEALYVQAERINALPELRATTVPGVLFETLARSRNASRAWRTLTQLDVSGLGVKDRGRWLDAGLALAPDAGSFASWLSGLVEGERAPLVLGALGRAAAVGGLSDIARDCFQRVCDLRTSESEVHVVAGLALRAARHAGLTLAQHGLSLLEAGPPQSGVELLHHVDLLVELVVDDPPPVSWIGLQELAALRAGLV